MMATILYKKKNVATVWKNRRGFSVTNYIDQYKGRPIGLHFPGTHDGRCEALDLFDAIVAEQEKREIDRLQWVYVYIVAWYSRHKRPCNQLVQQQLLKAKNSAAPQDAVYYDAELQKWVRLHELQEYCHIDQCLHEARVAVSQRCEK